MLFQARFYQDAMIVGMGQIEISNRGLLSPLLPQVGKGEVAANFSSPWKGVSQMTRSDWRIHFGFFPAATIA